MRPPIRAARTLTRHLPLRPSYTPQTRPFFSWLSAASPSTSSTITPLSASPHPALVQKADRIKAASLCPTSFEKHGGERVRPAFDCPDCGWPTHKNKERWEEGLAEHKEYCERLREVNMDEHDIRSGRKMKEFEDMPAEQPFEAAVSYSSWDTFFYTRQFRSVDSDQSMRHVSKVLTYPITIASVLHQNGPYTHGNGRITAEGRRSMAAIHSILHLPPGSSEQTAPIRPQPPFRIFLLGARAESTLPPSIWEQLTHIFPRTNFNIYFIGPEVGLPLVEAKRRKGYEFTPHDEYGVPAYTLNVSPRLRLTTLKANYEMLHENLGPFDPYSDVFYAFSPGLGFPHQPMNTASSAPPSTSTEGSTEGTDSAADGQAQEPAEPAQPLVQAQTGWRLPLMQILQTKCPLFFTAFSPLDLQRDVAALFGTTPPSSGSESPTVNAPSEFPQHVQLPTRPVPRIEGVTDEFELVLTPGKNEFGSLKWEIAEWDVRVGVKTNWGLWGIRGKKYEVVEGQEE